MATTTAMQNIINESVYVIDQYKNIDKDLLSKGEDHLVNNLKRYNYPKDSIKAAVKEFNSYFNM